MRSRSPQKRTWIGVQLAFGAWAIFTLYWTQLAILSGLAFDGGYTRAAYIFFWSVWTYPITLAFAFLLRRKFPAAVLLPLLNVYGIFHSWS